MPLYSADATAKDHIGQRQVSTIASAVAAAVDAERLRIKSIREAPEAIGREESASALAYHSSMPAADACRLMQTLETDAAGQEQQLARRIASMGRTARLN